MTARDDLLARLIDAQVRVIEAFNNPELEAARANLLAVIEEWEAANPTDDGPERDGLTWTAADEEAVAYLLVPDQRDGRADS